MHEKPWLRGEGTGRGVRSCSLCGISKRPWSSPGQHRPCPACLIGQRGGWREPLESLSRGTARRWQKRTGPQAPCEAPSTAPQLSLRKKPRLWLENPREDRAIGLMSAVLILPRLLLSLPPHPSVCPSAAGVCRERDASKERGQLPRGLGSKGVKREKTSAESGGMAPWGKTQSKDESGTFLSKTGGG